MDIDQTAELPSIIHATETDNQEDFQVKTSKAKIYFKLNAQNGICNQQTSQQADVSAVHYENAELRDSKISLRTALHEASSQEVQD